MPYGVARFLLALCNPGWPGHGTISQGCDIVHISAKVARQSLFS